ncbi:MAG: FAD-binding oxidoreductase [Alphaproteobacteria bacterium]|nr:FAD-binding oxidoreductase [Alphaproteobacteria bacterium]
MPERIDITQLPECDLTDDGGRRLEARLLTADDLTGAVRDAVEAGWAVMPAGGLTSAINSFSYDRAAAEAFKGVVAIRPRGATAVEIVPASTPIEALASNQMSIEPEAGLVTVGAGLSFEQANQALARAVGPDARILVDLTSVGSAQAGGVMATGGMGPLRRRPSTSCVALALATGLPEPLIVEGDEVPSHQGMQGWTGMATALRMRFFRTPPFEFGLVLPVQSSDTDTLAELLTYLHPWTAVTPSAETERLVGQVDPGTILNGIELVGRDALADFVANAQDQAVRAKALGLLQSCDYANADFLACLTGWSEHSVEDVLGVLLDAETETIGGVQIDYGVGFSSGGEMEAFRAIREGAPDLARTRARVIQPGKLKPWSASTDIDVAAPRDVTAIVPLLTAYEDYRDAIAGLTEQFEGRVDISLAAYGHLSPHGIDPHHRVVLIAPEGGEQGLADARFMVQAGKKALIRALVRAAHDRGCVVTGGEKGIPSVLEIASALGGEHHMPHNLVERIERARRALAAAPANFTFRAPAELRGTTR